MRTTAFYYFLLSTIVFALGCDSTSSPTKSLANLPIPITNNAVCGVTVDGKEYVYSFGGLSSGKTYKDITLRSFKYDVSNNLWSEIAQLPDTMGKIAAAANVIKNKIYIVGGYYVFPDGHEKSSPNVHVYDPVSDQYLKDAANIPTPIDDQVQAVWQDSLLYVVTGWSDSLNVGTVQVFEPDHNVWHYASPLPNDYSYAVFGSSGIISDNNLYYAGGAGNRIDRNFPIQSQLRIGKIDPSNALDITWSTMNAETAGIYRSAAVLIDEAPYWINGAGLSYNYNGVAYTGPKVEPLAQILKLNADGNGLSKIDKAVPAVMDLRGVAGFPNKVIIAGGMLPGQVVSDSTTAIYFN